MTTTDVLNLLLRTNLAAGAAVIAVAVVRKAVRRWLGARVAYGLWLTPVLAAGAVLIPARQVAVTLHAVPVSAASAVVLASGPGLAHATTSRLDPSLVLIGLWLTGAVIAAMAMAYMQWRFAADAARGAVGPAVVGVISPRIIMPEGFGAKFNAEEQALVLAHEQAHIARHDSRANALSVLAQCLFWFNPLVHLAARLARIDQEMACDETVIIRFPDARRAYARALVKAQLALRPLPLGCYWPSGTEHPLEERIAMLKTKTLRPALRLAGASALSLACAGAGLAAWAAQPPRMVVTTLAQSVAGVSPAARPEPAQAPVVKAARSAAPTSTPDAPAQVCISNDCVSQTAPTTSDPLSDAIARGDAAAVMASGGSGRQVIAAVRAGPNGAGLAQMLDQMADMENVTVSNLNGRAALVGTDSDGKKMLVVPPGLGPAPADAPVENVPQLAPGSRAATGNGSGLVIVQPTRPAP